MKNQIQNESLVIKIQGRELTDLYQNPFGFGLEVELDDELAAMFRLRIPIQLQKDGTWSYLNDERFMVWKKTVISAGFKSHQEELISGYITHVRPDFNPDPDLCFLELWGMDAGVLMDREEKLKGWPNKKDSDIAREILGAYGFGTDQVQDTQVVHDEAVSTIIQHETDMQFLKRLALRNGFEFYIEDSTGCFQAPRLNDPPQPVLAYLFGEQTNLNRFSLELNALTPSKVAMVQLERTGKEILEAQARSGNQKALGKINAPDLLPAGIKPAQIRVGLNGTTGSPEMTALCQGMYDQAEWFLCGEGEIDGNQYGHVLKNRRTITIKGVGEVYSGIYRVTHVTHSFTSEGYREFFKVKRNAIRPTGSERF